MAKPYNASYRKVKLPKPQHEFEEFGAGKKGIVMCEKCNIAYYKKAWHHSADSFVAKSKNPDYSVKFVLCPACQMIKNKQYEGEVIIMNVPEKSKNELLNLVNGYCERAFLKDPLDRLINIKVESGKGKAKSFDLIVTTTENELANKLAKKIKDAFNKVKIKTSFQKSPGDVAVVAVEFLSS